MVVSRLLIAGLLVSEELDSYEYVLADRQPILNRSQGLDFQAWRVTMGT